MRIVPTLILVIGLLAACHTIHASREKSHTLAMTSWNMQWLADPESLRATDFWRRCSRQKWPNRKLQPHLPYCDVYKRDGIRSAADYHRKRLVPLRATLAQLAAQQTDIIAVQEVQNPAALQAVLPDGYHVVCFTTREDAQNVGYAVRETANLRTQCREIRSLSLEDDSHVTHPVRRGLELSVDHQGKKLVMLNVHLKSACPKGRMDGSNEACRSLQHQVAPLEQWIEAQAGNSFMILGDWNRDLDQEIRGNYPARSDGSDPAGPLTDPLMVRNLFPEINDHVPAASNMRIALIDRSAADHDVCHDILDQLVISESLLQQLDTASLNSGRLAGTLLAPVAGASDHCPLRTVLRFQN